MIPGSAVIAAEKSASNTKADLSGKHIKYINDFMIAYVRQGRDASQGVVEAVSSGSAVEVLESRENYSKVRTAAGNVGWILNQDLRDDHVAREQLLQAQKHIALLESKLQQKDSELAEVNKGHNDLRKRFESMELKLRRIEADNQNVRNLASDPLKLAKLNKTLSLERQQLERELGKLRQQMTSLKDDTENRWFLTGAGVVFMSLLVGLMMPKFKSQRKSGWA